MIECVEIQELEKRHLKKDVPSFKIGDTVAVSMRIIEGEKERVQLFTGVVIARKGRGLSETFSLYRVSYGSGMERLYMLHSPLISKIEVVKPGKVRKAKLYYLRGKFGKASKVKEAEGVTSKGNEIHQET
jgi:large subunit ribosomal protein L19